MMLDRFALLALCHSRTGCARFDLVPPAGAVPRFRHTTRGVWPHDANSQKQTHNGMAEGPFDSGRVTGQDRQERHDAAGLGRTTRQTRCHARGDAGTLFHTESHRMLSLTIANGRYVNFYLQTPHGPKRLGRFIRNGKGHMAFDFDSEVIIKRSESDSADWSDWEHRKEGK